jgi:hypothetical protein
MKQVRFFNETKAYNNEMLGETTQAIDLSFY